MNLVLEYSKFDIHKVHFLDTKRNIIIDGIFTKMVYLDGCVSLNAIYIALPCKYSIERSMPRCNVVFSSDPKENQDIVDLEMGILVSYMKHCQIQKRTNTSLATQVASGKTRLYSENTHECISGKPEIVLKISGVWETEHEIGVTYKFVEMAIPPFMSNTSASIEDAIHTPTYIQSAL